MFQFCRDVGVVKGVLVFMGSVIVCWGSVVALGSCSCWYSVGGFGVLVVARGSVVSVGSCS